MSEFTDVFAELLDVNDESCGKPQFILLNGKKHRAIIETIPHDLMIVGGGEAQSARFRAQIASVGEKPERQEEAVQILGKGQMWDLLDADSVNSAVYILTIGDLSAEDRG